MFALLACACWSLVVGEDYKSESVNIAGEMHTVDKFKQGASLVSGAVTVVVRYAHRMSDAD